MIQAVEQAIIDRLAGRIEGVHIGAFPDSPRDYRLTHPVGALLVHYSGSKYGSPTGYASQERTLSFDIVVVTRALRDGKKSSGAYGLIEAVRKAIAGYRMPGCQPCYLNSDGYSYEAGGVWYYTVAASVPTVAVFDPDAENVPTVKKITGENFYGNVEVNSNAV